MSVSHVAAARDVAAPVPGCHGVMASGVYSIALAFLPGGMSAAAAGLDPLPSPPSLSSDRTRLTLRQAEVLFGARNRELQLMQ